jgi:DNA-binding Lrp family transcriptional regulator
VESLTIDDFDRQLVHALGLDGRAPFSRIAEVLGVSDQTVARRYRKLRGNGLMRVVGLRNPATTDGTRWWLRLRCAPGTAPAIATALARRPDTSWVQLVSGGTEILCAARADSPAERDALLLDKLPRTGRIISVSAHSMLHMFFGGSMGGYPEIFAVLDEEQVARLSPPWPGLDETGIRLGELDERLFDALATDGRTSHAELAAVTGWSESTVRRRIDQLWDAGALFWDLEVDAPAFGFHTEAWLWMSVRPSKLAEVGAELATHPEMAFAAATTGPSNIAASVLCRDSAGLYRYVTERLGSIDAIRHLETAPIIRTVKQAGTLLPATRRTA